TKRRGTNRNSKAIQILTLCFESVRTDDRLRRRIAGVALPPHQTGRTHNRRKKRNWRLARRALLERIPFQTNLPRSLGNQTRNVIGAKRREENAQRPTSNIQRRSQNG